MYKGVVFIQVFVGYPLIHHYKVRECPVYISLDV